VVGQITMQCLEVKTTCIIHSTPVTQPPCGNMADGCAISTLTSYAVSNAVQWIWFSVLPDDYNSAISTSDLYSILRL